VITIRGTWNVERGKKHWLWRAINADGDVLDILVQPRRNAKAAKHFFKGLAVRSGESRVLITPSRDIATQCTVGQQRNCEATSSQSKHWPRTLTTARTKA